MEAARSLGVLVVEDDASLRNSLVESLGQASYVVEARSSAAEALHTLKSASFDIILCDLKLPDMDGMQLIPLAREAAPNAVIVLMTAFGSSETAIRALRAGAYDYLAKPFSMDELLLTLRKIEEREQLLHENEELRSAITQKYNFSNIVAESAVMKDIFETVKRLANFSTTVLITGESGTGKELLAKAVHHNSPRRGRPFVAINCGAIPESLMESELFGHKKGAFTDATRDKKGLFEEATGGTIFLDEIGELPAHLQVKLLRALQEQQIRRVGDEQVLDIDVRVIAATLRNLDDDVQSGRFREDLYYRLNVVSINIPPLRERREDIPVLVEHFLKKHNKRLGLSIKQVSPEAMRAFMDHYWKGNVRELENCIERALVLTESEVVDLESLPEGMRQARQESENTPALPHIGDDNLSIKQRTRALEVALILKALKKTGGNRTRAAKVLEISHRALLYKLKEYGLT